MVRKTLPGQGSKIRNIEEMIRRTPPHLLSKHNRKHLSTNESTFMSHPIGNISTNLIKTSIGNYDQFGYGGSSLPLQDHSMYTGIVPQEGETKRYLYLPMLLSIIEKTSSGSPYEEGTPRSSDTEHQRPSHGGCKAGESNPWTTDYHPPYQLSSFYPVVPNTNGNDDWNQPKHQELAHFHLNEPGRMPFYGNSHDTKTDKNNTTSPRETSSLILGKRPAASNASLSFFRPLPTRQPLNTPDECTDELFGLVQSVGTPEFQSSWDKVFRSGSSMYGSHHTSSTHATEATSGTASEPSLTLGLRNGGANDKGKGKEEDHSYWALSGMAEMRDSMKKQRKRQIGLHLNWHLVLDMAAERTGADQLLQLMSNNKSNEQETTIIFHSSFP